MKIHRFRLALSGRRRAAAGVGFALALAAGTSLAQPTPFPPSSPVLGCFKDQGDPNSTAGRDLSGFMFRSANMTNDVCRQACGDKRFKYAATQAGSFCLCGNEYGKYGPSQDCRDRCTGDAGQICGGPWANLVSTSLPPAVQKMPPPSTTTPPVQSTVQAPPYSVPTAMQVPPAPANGGQCVISISGAGYNHQEIQRWEVVGGPMSSAALPGQTYALSWTARGQESVGSTTYKISAADSSDALWVRPRADGYTLISRQVPQVCPGNSIDTTPPGPWCVYGPGYPSLAAPPGAHGASDDKTFPIDALHPWGYQKPSDASGSATCHWNVAF